MMGRSEARTEPVGIPAKAVRQSPTVLTPSRRRDPALGIVVAIAGAAVIWVIIALMTIYGLR